MLHAHNNDVADIEFEISQESQKSVLKLMNAEKRLIHKIGEIRVAELRLFSQKRLSSSEQEVFKKSLNHHDKKLTWIWFRLERIQYTMTRNQRRPTGISRRSNQST